MSPRPLVEVARFSRDVEALTRFYADLLATGPAEEWPGGATFVAGDVTLLLHELSEPVAGGPPNEDHVAVAVPDLDEACAALRARGIDLLHEARDHPWGRSAYLRDPDGRLVELQQL